LRCDIDAVFRGQDIAMKLIVLELPNSIVNVRVTGTAESLKRSSRTIEDIIASIEPCPAKK
jgi:hypothetical protein